MQISIYWWKIKHKHWPVWIQLKIDPTKNTRNNYRMQTPPINEILPMRITNMLNNFKYNNNFTTVLLISKKIEVRASAEQQQISN